MFNIIPYKIAYFQEKHRISNNCITSRVKKRPQNKAKAIYFSITVGGGINEVKMQLLICFSYEMSPF